MDAATIATALGGQRSGHGWTCRCPAHNDRTPSLSITESAGKILVKCHAGCPQDKVVSALTARGLWLTDRSRSLVVREQKSLPAREEDAGEEDTWRIAWDILRAALVAKAGAPKDYFRSRGLTTVPPNAMVLPAKCWHSLQKRHHKITLPDFPAMVMPITDGRKLQGVLVTMLSRDGKQNLADRNDKNMRRIFGKKKGGFVQLGELDPDQPLIVAEGVEDVLSAMELSDYSAGVVALGSLNDFIPPPCSEVIIAADNDSTGREGARVLSDKLKSLGGKVCIR